ncbi:Methyltransferase-like protein 7B [Termitomyces sp. T112]|nr:Methyltransferase-like protein 7B [Termitomyces sp. T112]
MKFSAAFSLLSDLRSAFGVAIGPTLRDVIRQPVLIFRPTLLSRVFMSHVWAAFAAGTDEGSRPVKEKLLPENALGAVLDIGAGHGHSVNYLDRKLVSRYIALEPNTFMHPHIRAIASKAGFVESDGSLAILSCGAEDIQTIISHLGGKPYPVDTIVSILTLCSIPAPEQTLNTLVRDVLKPGGKLLFYEHVLSPRQDVAWWQRFWTPVWRIPFDGCRLDRPSHLFAERMMATDRNGNRVSMWSSQELWGKDGEPEEHLFWHRVGRFVKRLDT